MGDNRKMVSENGALRVGVIGAGAFGRNHARVYCELAADPSQHIDFIGVADTDLSRAKAVAPEFKTRAFRSAEELVAAGLDAASVAVPTVLHLDVARALMQSGVDVLIEKPLATSVTEADEF